jgi:D-alanyl-D-alanine carboxypeptidase
MEERKLKLSDPVTKYISKAHAQLLKDEGHEPQEITIRHLLTHTSGLFDHGSSAEYLQRIIADPQHVWTRTEQIAGSMAWGSPVGTPGEKFSYSDTGYLLLGEAIEKITGKSLGIALREMINYKKLEMQDTWFELTEETPTQALPRVHQYLDTIDTHDFHPSLDLYGGGGIVTTMEDLTDFILGLFSHSIYGDVSTLDTMLASVSRLSAEKPKLDYRMGIWLQQYENFDAWTHSGFWGVQVWYVPEIKASVAIAVVRQDDYYTVKRIFETFVNDILKS